MKEYIKKNHTPIMFGFSGGLLLSIVLNALENIIIKIALIIMNFLN